MPSRLPATRRRLMLSAVAEIAAAPMLIIGAALSESTASPAPLVLAAVLAVILALVAVTLGRTAPVPRAGE